MTGIPELGLSVAAGIAAYLSESACRSGDRCTWLGTTQDAEDGSEEVVFRYGTLGSDLYGGTSGVALFLAEVFRHTGDAPTREAAIAGMHQALDGAGTIPPECRLGFYAGQVGVAWAAIRVSRLTGREDLERRAGTLLDGLGDLIDRPVMVDLIAGGTGAIPPLLALGGLLDRPGLRDLAMSLGRATVAAASRDDGGWVWPVSVSGIEAARPLTGFSHGAAGIGWALLELGQATGDRDCIEAAHQAFRYENRWFRPAEDNWPDFRDSDEESAPACEGWCHGAPGIGLSRLRAIELGYREYEGDAAAAIRTTRAALADRDRWIEGDFSLCHGRAGLGEVLRYAVSVQGDPDRTLPAVAAEAAAARYGTAWGEWPCGVRRGSNPSLMLGLAGIGWFYLGLADPAVPSVLLPG